MKRQCAAADDYEEEYSKISVYATATITFFTIIFRQTLARELSQSGEGGRFSEGTDLDKQSLLEAAENRRTSKLNKDSLGGSAKEELTELDKQSLLLAAADRRTRKSRVELLGRTDKEELTKSDKESLPAVVTNRRLGLARTKTSDEILTTTKQELSELRKSHSAYSSNRRLELARSNAENLSEREGDNTKLARKNIRLDVLSGAADVWTNSSIGPTNIDLNSINSRGSDDDTPLANSTPAPSATTETTDIIVNENIIAPTTTSMAVATHEIDVSITANNNSGVVNTGNDENENVETSMMFILERLAAGTTAKATKETDLTPADEIITAQQPPQSLPRDAAAGFVGNEDGEIDNLEINVVMGTIEDDAEDDGSTAAVTTEKQSKEKILYNNFNAADVDNDESPATETINNKVAATTEIAAAIIDGTGGDVAAGVTSKVQRRSLSPPSWVNSSIFLPCYELKVIVFISKPFYILAIPLQTIKGNTHKIDYKK